MPKKNLHVQNACGADRRTFSVVTPNYNMGDYLKATIESVLRNLRPGDQYFIIDGDSSDGSVDVIRSYEAHLTGWVSEPDVGYADAIEKGFSRASGDYLCWVNSGDLLLDGALDCASAELEQTRADLVFGDDLLIDEVDGVIQVTNGHAADLRAMMLYAGWTPLQESCFWTRSFYERVGGIDPAVKYAADYDLFLRMSLSGNSRYIPAVFGAFRRHDGQLSMAKTALYQQERMQCRRRELDALPTSLFTPLINAYYWFKVRWRVRIQAKKRNMKHLIGNSATNVPCQKT